MSNKNKMKPLYKEGSLAHIAHLSLLKIKRYTSSEFLIDRLVGLNIFIFGLVLAIVITTWLPQLSNQTIEFNISLLIYLVVGIFLGLGSSYGYSFLLESILNRSKTVLFLLRCSIVIEFIAITFALSGLFFKLLKFTNLSLILILLQFLILLVGIIFDVKKENEDTKISEVGIWGFLGKVSTMITIGTFVVDLVLLLLKLRF